MLDLLVLSLAVWRVSLLVTAEDGPPFFVDEGMPLGVFAWLRTRLALGELDHPDRWHFFLNGLVGCVWCLSLWLGLAAALLYWLWPGVTIALAFPFALSGLAVLFQEQVKD